MFLRTLYFPDFIRTELNQCIHFFTFVQCVFIMGVKFQWIQSTFCSLEQGIIWTMEAQGEAGRVDTTMSSSRIPSPADLSCPVAENWCYTQVIWFLLVILLTFIILTCWYTTFSHQFVSPLIIRQVVCLFILQDSAQYAVLLYCCLIKCYLVTWIK